MSKCFDYRIKDIFKSFVDEDKFIFKAINDLLGEESDYDWYTSTLDDEYFYSRSYDKIISPLVERLLSDDRTISTTNFARIVNIISNKYVDKWNKLFKALVDTAYNPIENYNMEELETPDVTKTIHREQNTNVNVGVTDGESVFSTKGFNSTDFVQANKQTINQTQNTSGDVDDNYMDGTETETGTRTKTRTGNIGVTTTQQMLEQEIEIKKHNIYEIMFRDVDEILTLDVY